WRPRRALRRPPAPSDRRASRTAGAATLLTVYIGIVNFAKHASFSGLFRATLAGAPASVKTHGQPIFTISVVINLKGARFRYAAARDAREHRRSRGRLPPPARRL